MYKLKKNQKIERERELTQLVNLNGNPNFYLALSFLF